jgi:hypothetical protein
VKVNNLPQVISAIRGKPNSGARFKMTIKSNLFNGDVVSEVITNIKNICYQYNIRCDVDNCVAGLLGLSNEYKIQMEGNANNLVPVLEYIHGLDDV